ncbi:hypothetical protein L6452_10090 [Arctium lappa]|uniref:Uncharacterized protein n=1 Tax=Arctium lappa TaxID=4217 RepID=A0ACB9DMQ3_ARCLA|nr:hypothetical protein L6452_10090 [Arctium lappa]
MGVEETWIEGINEEEIQIRKSARVNGNNFRADGEFAEGMDDVCSDEVGKRTGGVEGAEQSRCMGMNESCQMLNDRIRNSNNLGENDVHASRSSGLNQDPVPNKNGYLHGDNKDLDRHPGPQGKNRLARDGSSEENGIL